MYEEHFGLKSRPFSSSADGAAVFVGPIQTKFMKNMNKGLRATDSIVVISGLAGVGKTTLVSRALESISPARMVARIGRIELAPNEVLQILLKGFGVDCKTLNIIQRVAAFRRLLAEHDATGSRITIVVEDAQHLGADALVELEALSADEFGDDLGANIVLMGQPDLQEWLDTPALQRLHQRTRIWQTVEPLGKPEVLGYLRNSIRIAGGEFERIFAEDAAGMLHRCSAGIPLVINNICESGLTLAAENDAAPLTAEFIHRLATETLGIEVADELDEDSAAAEPPVVEPAGEPAIAVSKVGEADSAGIDVTEAEGADADAANTEVIESQAAASDTIQMKAIAAEPSETPAAETADDETPSLDDTMTEKRPDWMLQPGDNGGAATGEDDADESANAKTAADNIDDENEEVPAVLTAEVEATARLEVIDPLAPFAVADAAPETQAQPAPVAEPELALEPDVKPESQPEITVEPNAEPEPQHAAMPQPDAEPEAQPIPEMTLELEPEAESQPEPVPGAPLEGIDELPATTDIRPQTETADLTGPKKEKSPIEVAAEQADAAGDPTLEGIPELTLDNSLDQARSDPQQPTAAENPPKPRIDPKVAEELSKATSLDDLDDEMAATLFGDEDFDAIAAAAIANTPANDDDGAPASGDAEPAAAEAAATEATPVASAETPPTDVAAVASAKTPPTDIAPAAPAAKTPAAAQPPPAVATQPAAAAKPDTAVTAKPAATAGPSIAATAKPGGNKINGATPPNAETINKLMGYTGEFQMSMTSRFRMLDELTKDKEKPVYSTINRAPGATAANGVAAPNAGAELPQSLEQQLQEKAAAPSATHANGAAEDDAEEKPKTSRLGGLLSRFKR